MAVQARHCQNKILGLVSSTPHSLTNFECPNRKFHNPSSGPKLHGVRHQEQDKWVQMSPFFGQGQEEHSAQLSKS